MPVGTVFKIAKWVAGFLLVYAAFIEASDYLPFPWNLCGISVLFLGAVRLALFFLDMMVPGINLFSRAVTHLPPEMKDAVALTFDDGPVDPYTRQVLDILDRYNAKGTFFCLGQNIERHPELVREIVRRGHTLGNHSYSHRVLPFLSSDECRQEIQLGAAAIQRVIGKLPVFVRAPKGYKSRGVTRVIDSMNCKLIGFTYPIYDIQNPQPQVLVDRVLSRVKAGDIIVMHDGYGPGRNEHRDSLVAALPAILEGLGSKGLRAVGLDAVTF